MYRRQLLLSLLNQNTKTVHFACENGHIEKNGEEIEKLHFQPGEMIDNLKFVPNEGFYLPATIYFGPTIEEKTYDSLTGEITFKGPKGNTYIRANGASAFSCEFRLANCKIVNQQGEEINSIEYIPNQSIIFTIIPLGVYSLPSEITFSSPDIVYSYNTKTGVVNFTGVAHNSYLEVVCVIKHKCTIHASYCIVVDENGNEKKVWEFVPGQNITLYARHTTYQYNLPFEAQGSIQHNYNEKRDRNNVIQDNIEFMLIGGESDGDIFINAAYLPWDGQIENLFTDILTTDNVGLIATTIVNNNQHQVRLISIDHYDLASGSGKAHTVWEFATLLSDGSGNAIKKAIGLRNDGGGIGVGNDHWSGSEMDNYLVYDVYNLLSRNLQQKIKYVNINCTYGISSELGDPYPTKIETFQRRIFIAAAAEIASYSSYLDTSKYFNVDEGKTFIYYSETGERDNKRIKYDVNNNNNVGEGKESGYWLRSKCAMSPFSGEARYDQRGVGVIGESNYLTYEPASGYYWEQPFSHHFDPYPLAPVFCI